MCIRDSFLLEVQSRMVSVDALDVDVGAGGHFGGEGEDDAGAADAGELVNNVVEVYNLQPCDMSKSELKDCLLAYGKRIARHIKEHNPEYLPQYKAKCQEWVPKLIKMHSDVVLWMGESMDYTATIGLQFWKEEDDPAVTSYFYFIKDGLFLGYPGFGKQTNDAARVK
eukprot:TRINITY_DN19445_c0_g1_i2.p1 TRINITY_DN19445_c0_g1~~TRINITY_DN19445_c0_g1_i2.p1  ORF type:complete len:168 (-),score=48.86 TRINITY_DN19445_c0_g1_i2:17-520(-)